MSVSKRSGKGIKLKVMEANTPDVGRGIARLDPVVAEKYGIQTGDVIKITGPRKSTAAVVWHGYPQDRNRGIIRIDGYVRKNAGVSLGDYVYIEKIEPVQAQRVVLAPTMEGLRLGGNVGEFLRHRFENRVMSVGDYIEIPTIAGRFLFIVKSVQPRADAVIITLKTEMVVTDQPVKESELGKIPKVTYEDIGGLSDAIQKIREMVELPMKHPELFERIGIEPPKGVLLYGPPGTGKTLLAKALANETNANFYTISGPEIMSKFYGESEQNLRKVFEEAEKNAPSIIFIDEIDSIAPKRDETSGEVERRVVAQLLALMDGMQSRGQVVVIGATNRPNAIDPALRRPGRFDREIEIGIPNKQGRLEILQIHTRGMPLSDDVNLQKLAEITHGFVGADLAALAKEAALNALRRILPEIDLEQKEIPQEVLEKIEITQQDFIDALATIEPSALREVIIDVPNVHWDDIGGLHDVKKQLIKTIEWHLKYPKLFKHFKAKQPKGILLYGPPGTGKTMLAKAVATETQSNFISVKGPELLSKWVGESEKAVREIFRKARQAAPCVIFFDEIDSLAPRRGGGADSHVTERIVSQLLTELDGIEELSGVVVIGATNRIDMVDTALLRPGRFDYLLEVGLPDKESRIEIFKVHTRGKPLADDVDLNELAEKTEGFSGADIEAVVNEATLMAIEDALSQFHSEEELEKLSEDQLKNYKIKKEHFMKALDKISKERKYHQEKAPEETMPIMV